jgi:hypothetical protein
MHNAHYSCQILTKLEFASQIFEKYSNTRFNEYPYCGRRVVPCGWMDGRTDMFAILRAHLKHKKTSVNSKTTNDYVLKLLSFTFTEFI